MRRSPISKVTSSWRSLVLSLLVTGIGILGAPAQTSASVLSEFECADLRAKRDALISLGASDDLNRGATWARANLNGDRLSRVRQFLVAMEQVLFRCRSIPRELSDGMDFAVNMPDPKPFHERRTFPLPVRKPASKIGLRSTTQ